MKQAKRAAVLLAAILCASLLCGAVWAEESKPSPYRFSDGEGLQWCIEEYQRSGAKSRQIEYVPGSEGAAFVFDRNLVIPSWLQIDLTAADVILVAEGVSVENNWIIESEAQFIVKGAWHEYGTTYVCSIEGKENCTIYKEGQIVIVLPHDGDRDGSVSPADGTEYLRKERAVAACQTLKFLVGIG